MQLSIKSRWNKHASPLANWCAEQVRPSAHQQVTKWPTHWDVCQSHSHFAELIETYASEQMTPWRQKDLKQSGLGASSKYQPSGSLQSGSLQYAPWACRICHQIAFSIEKFDFQNYAPWVIVHKELYSRWKCIISQFLVDLAQGMLDQNSKGGERFEKQKKAAQNDGTFFAGPFFWVGGHGKLPRGI